MGRVSPLILCLAGAMARAQSPIVSQVYGIDFSPYENGQDPNLGSQITISQIQARMQIVAPYTNWVRSFSSTNGLENIPSVARQFGLKVAANAWISSDTAQNAIEISNLIAAGNAGLIDIAIVGRKPFYEATSRSTSCLPISARSVRRFPQRSR
jgi:exo-beta-1,3-glucanase (GH17 family)